MEGVGKFIKVDIDFPRDKNENATNANFFNGLKLFVFVTLE